MAEPVKSGAFLLSAGLMRCMEIEPDTFRKAPGFSVQGSGGRAYNEPGDLNQVLWPQPQEIERRLRCFSGERYWRGQNTTPSPSRKIYSTFMTRVRRYNNSVLGGGFWSFLIYGFLPAIRDTSYHTDRRPAAPVRTGTTEIKKSTSS